MYCLLCINHICICPPDLVNKLILISISIRKNCIRRFFLSILQEEFLPWPVHPALFHNFGFYYIILMGHKKNQDKNEQFNIAYDQW